MNNLDLLIPQAQREATDTWRWATVTATGPLRIRLDGETDALDITPDNTIGPLAVGDRVWTQTSGRRILVTGRAGGIPVPSATPGEPVGTIKMYAGDTAPDGYLMCSGGTFSSVTYPLLAAIVGDKFGAHSGTTYYLPQMGGRTPVGLDATQAEFNGIGKTGGSKTHKLTWQELPNHSHSLPGHVFNWGTNGTVSVTGTTAIAGSGPGNRLYTFQNDWLNTNSSGGGEQPHNIIQPYITMNYIICAR